MKNYQRRLPLTSLLLLICGGCWLLNPPRIRLVSEGMPLTFAFQGDRRILNVYVDGPFLPDANGTVVPHETINPLHRNLIWSIDGPIEDVSLDNAPHITYGQLPKGWRPRDPKSGPPPPLVDGMVYNVGANMDEGLRVRMCVLIRNGKAQQYHGKYNGYDCDGE